MVVIELPEAYGYVVLANGIVAFVSNFLLAGCASALSHAGAMSAIPSLTRSLPGQERHQGTPTVRCPAAKLVRRARRAQGCRRFQPRSTRSPKRSRVCHAGRCDVSDGRDQTPVRCCAWHRHELCWKLLLPIGLRGYKARCQNGALQEGRRRAVPNLPTVGRPPTRLCVLCRLQVARHATERWAQRELCGHAAKVVVSHTAPLADEVQSEVRSLPTRAVVKGTVR